MNKSHETEQDLTATTTLASACLQSCRKLVSQVGKVRAAILAEFRDRLEAHERMLVLALNEAEALAWQTAVPQLVFPTLALEKAQAVAAWYGRQQALRQTSSLSTTR
jgi:hypothetical protein